MCDDLKYPTCQKKACDSGTDEDFDFIPNLVPERHETVRSEKQQIEAPEQWERDEQGTEVQRVGNATHEEANA